MSRLVGHRILDGVIEVYALARSLPEAVALESALKCVPNPEAFGPALPIPSEDELPPHALADAEDFTAGLTAQTRSVVDVEKAVGP